MAMILCLAMVIVAGCGSSSPTTVGPTPSPTAPPEDFPAATTTYQDSGATGYVIPENNIGTTVGTLDTLATKSDGTNLYVKILLKADAIGQGRTICLLVDDTAQNSGFPVNDQFIQYLPWDGAYAVQISNFDPDFAIGVMRKWDSANPTVNSTAAFTYIGNTQNSYTDVTSQCSAADIAADHSTFEFQIPYSVIGSNGAARGAKLKPVALLARGAYKDNNGTFQDPSQRPLGTSSVIPGNAITITDSGLDTVRVSKIGSYVKCTLE